MKNKDLKIYLAAPRGFCAGVDRAIEIVKKSINKFGSPVYVRHEIVHNKHVVENLKKIGAIFVEEISEIKDKTRPVIFSAHGVPKSYVEEAGDPYKQQIEDCSLLIINELEKCLGHSNPHTLSYQSRVGPVEWLKPYTEEVLADLGRSNVNDLIVVPISFVGEHIETLQEIDIEYKEIAVKAGIKNFRRVKALNTHPTFIEGLSDLVISCLEGPLVNIEEASQLPEKVKLYPQEKWQWGWNNSSEVWNGRVAMIIFLVLFVELISGSGPLHKLGIL